MPADTFVETSTTALASHVPTGPNAGTGWTIEEQSGGTGLRINATSDRLEATASGAGLRVIASLQPDPVRTEYDVKFTIPTLSTIATSPIFAIARYVDANNYYGAGVYRASDSPDCVLYKKVGGVVTLLASTDLGVTAGMVMTFKVRDTSKKLFAGAAEMLTTADNELTAKGKAGFAMGSCFVAADDIGVAWEIDDFSHMPVAETNAAVAYPIIQGIIQGSAVAASLAVPLDWSAQSEQPMPGDLLIGILNVIGGTVLTWPGWTPVGTTTGPLQVRTRIFQAGDDLLELTFSASTKVLMLVGIMRNTLLIETASVTSGGPDTAPNPPAITPSWGTANTLWIAVAGWSDTALCEATADPANYTDLIYHGAAEVGGQFLGLSVSARQFRASTDNPGALTLTENALWNTVTLALAPDGETHSVPGAADDMSMMVRAVADGITDLVKRLEITNDSGRSITVVIEGNSTSRSETVADGADAEVDVLTLAIPNSSKSITIT